MKTHTSIVSLSEFKAKAAQMLEDMKAANGDSGVKHKIAHNMMITKEDIARVAKMKDVNLDFSPHIPYPHPGIVSGYIPSVGKARHDRMFPVRTAIEAGIHVGHGSDWLTAQSNADSKDGAQKR